MPYYSPLKKWNYKDLRRTIKGIQALRKQKQARIPKRTLEDTLLLATWNIRDFGNEDKRSNDSNRGQSSFLPL